MRFKTHPVQVTNADTSSYASSISCILKCLTTIDQISALPQMEP